MGVAVGELRQQDLGEVAARATRRTTSCRFFCCRTPTAPGMLSARPRHSARPRRSVRQPVTSPPPARRPREPRVRGQPRASDVAQLGKRSRFSRSVYRTRTDVRHRAHDACTDLLERPRLSSILRRCGPPADRRRPASLEARPAAEIDDCSEKTVRHGEVRARRPASTTPQDVMGSRLERLAAIQATYGGTTAPMRLERRGASRNNRASCTEERAWTWCPALSSRRSRSRNA